MRTFYLDRGKVQHNGLLLLNEQEEPKKENYMIIQKNYKSWKI